MLLTFFNHELAKLASVRTHFHEERAMIEDFQRNAAAETGVDGWRCNVRGKTQSGLAATAFDPRGELAFQGKVNMFQRADENKGTWRDNDNPVRTRS